MKIKTWIHNVQKSQIFESTIIYFDNPYIHKHKKTLNKIAWIGN